MPLWRGNALILVLGLFFFINNATAIPFFRFLNKGKYDDPYQVLGVKRTATDDDIKKAYRQKAKEIHPDRNPAPDSSEKFRRVADAYEKLRSPDERRRYDEEQTLRRQRDEYHRKQRHGSRGFRSSGTYLPRFDSHFVWTVVFIFAGGCYCYSEGDVCFDSLEFPSMLFTDADKAMPRHVVHKQYAVIAPLLHKYRTARSYRQATDPRRVAALAPDLRRVRVRQQELAVRESIAATRKAHAKRAADRERTRVQTPEEERWEKRVGEGRRVGH